MQHNMILSASGWRKVFAKSGEAQDNTPEIGAENTVLAVIAAEVFSDYIRNATEQQNPVIVCGMDARPTGPAISSAVIHTLLAKKIIVRYLGITAAPEIMAYAKKLDGFIYITASHNPVGHNGLKFGLNDGGVLNAEENAKLVKSFTEKCADLQAMQKAATVLNSCSTSDVDWIYAESPECKQKALSSYKSFIREVITAVKTPEKQNDFFSQIRKSTEKHPVGVVCDMNGSARTLSIDKDFFTENGISFYAINNTAGDIVHEIIPEAENLVWCAKEMEWLQAEGHTDAVIGYMPDCDGDRGNIVYWDEKKQKADILKAQEVFSLAVLSELSYADMLYGSSADYKPAVAVNGPTSMRINEIADIFGAKVFRAEVGEANVVNTARNARKAGFTVRICGEGSNGGNITHPSSVRDPLSSVFAIIKLMNIDGLYRTWCRKSGHTYKKDFTLTDVISTIPAYTTTGVSEPRAVLHITTTDHALLKGRFQKIFETEWKLKSDTFSKKYGIISFEAVLTNGTTETRNAADFSKSGSGGLKIIFYDREKNPCAFIWMRGSGTEPVFRIMCDVKGADEDEESELLQWETDMVKEADN
ncbi:MAG: phosphoglucomutase [Treponema sp.]